MIFCSVKGCYCYERQGSKQRFFRFPRSPQRALLWHEFCQDPSLSTKIHPSTVRYICDKHFLESDFVKPDLHLKAGAIPSVNKPNPTNLKVTDGNHLAEKITISAFKRKSFDSNSESFMSDVTCNKLEVSSQPSQIKYKNLRNSKRPKESKLLDLTKTSPDTSNLVLEQTSNVLKSLDTIIKSYQQIDPGLKLSLIKSIGPNLAVKQNASTRSDQRPLKIYKSVHKNVEVKLQPQLLFPQEEIEKEVIKPEKRDDILQISQKQITLINDCAFENLDITLNSTLVFESASNSFTPNMMVKPKTCTKLPVTNLLGVNLQTKNMVTNENFSLKPLHPNSVKNKTIHSNSKVDFVLPLAVTHSNSLQKPLGQTNVVRRGKLRRYRSKVFNKKPFPTHLDVNDPKYSIAAIAESLGTFNSFVEEPVEKVDLEAGEWHKLYEPSETKFPQLKEFQIGQMVNNLRSKLPTFNDRDKLEVSFLLSMMSVYPSAPKHIKEVLSQRLNLVYIATMFKWNTALALGVNLNKQTTTQNTLSSKKNSKYRFRNKKCQTPNLLASSNINLNSVKNYGTSLPDKKKDNYCTNTNNFPLTSKDNLNKSAKLPQFAFEIIVQEKSSVSLNKHKKRCNTIKEL